MEDFDDIIRCYPFSDFIRCSPFSDDYYEGPKPCCDKMYLVPVLSHSFKCQTCLLRKDAPEGVAPIFPANECADEHFTNNHTLSCLSNENFSENLL